MRPICGSRSAMVVLVAAIEITLLSCTHSERAPLVFAAASLADALEEVEREAGLDVDFHFAGSNTLARQILSAAPAQLFVSANLEQMDRLIDAGRVDPASVVSVAANRLVVIVPEPAARSGRPPWRQALLEAARVAVADPEGVPAGVYARQWLDREGLWPLLEDRLVVALDVRSALHAVASGAVDIGIVYATDARTTDRVTVIHQVGEAEGPAVHYVAAPLPAADGSIAPEVREFMDALTSATAREIFERHGFHGGDAP